MKILKFAPLPCAVLAAVLAFGCAENGEAPAEEEYSANSSIKVGRADMEALFHSYAGAEEFQRKAEDIQRRFEELEEEDFEQMMQIQSEFQFLQTEFFQNFQEDVETAAKTISEDMELDAIAVEILHSCESVELIDITEAFLETDFFSAGHSHSESCGPECR